MFQCWKAHHKLIVKNIHYNGIKTEAKYDKFMIIIININAKQK